MKKKKAIEDKARPRVSRSGRVVKRVPQIYEVPHRILNSEHGRWTAKDKERLLACLRKFPGIQYQPLTIYRSVKCKSRDQVQKYLLRMKRKAAAHIVGIRRKQPPILTWFQVADEVTWLKEDEMLDQIIPTLLGLHVKEANTMQEKNPILNFSNLYKYLKMLHKNETLPELTPAESVILLDCFQQLVDTLRASETQPQTEFMQKQYQRYFHLLHFATTPTEGSNSRGHEQEKSGWPKGAKPAKPKAAGNQRPSVGPIMKAELRKKRPRGKAGRRKKVLKSPNEEESQSPEAGQDGSNQNAAPSKEGDKTPEAEEQGKDLTEAETEEINGIHRTQDVSENGEEGFDPGPENSSQADGLEEGDASPGVAGQEGSRSMNNHDAPSHNLDPNDPDFLSKFADMLSLGSLNPFDIPTDLLNFRPKATAVRAARQGDVGNPTDRGVKIPRDSAVGRMVIDLKENDPNEVLDAEVRDLDVSGRGVSTSNESLDRTNDNINMNHGTERCVDNRSRLSNDRHASVPVGHQPVVSSTSSTVVTNFNQGAVSGGHVPVVSSASQPVVTNFNQGAVSGGHQPVVYSTSSTVVTNFNQGAVSGVRLPVVSSANQPVVTPLNQGAVPGGQPPPGLRINLPAIPSLQQCGVPSASQPVLPSVSQQAVSGFHQPAVLSINLPRVSGTSLPAVTNVNYHAIPGIHQPPVLSVNLPVVSNVNQYVLPNISQPLLMSSSRPVVTISCQPVIASSSQSVVTSSFQPVTASSSQSLVTSACQPVIASSSQPIVTSSCQPVIASSSRPVVTISCQPVIASSSQSVVVSSCQPAVASSYQPVVASSSQPVVVSSCQPVVVNSSQPVVVSSCQPAVASSCQPVVTSSCQPVIASSSQPVVASSSQPVVASSSQPVIASSSKPVETSSCQPVVASSCQPVVISHSQPIATISCQPVVTCSSQPAVTSATQTIVSTADQPAVVTSAS